MAKVECSRCNSVHDRNGRYCRPCHNWRKSHPLNDLQRKKDNARSYAGVYKRRGKLIEEPCSCGAGGAEMHHPDYDKPLIVIWMCRACHLQHHSDLST